MLLSLENTNESKSMNMYRKMWRKIFGALRTKIVLMIKIKRLEKLKVQELRSLLVEAEIRQENQLLINYFKTRTVKIEDG